MIKLSTSSKEIGAIARESSASAVPLRSAATQHSAVTVPSMHGQTSSAHRSFNFKSLGRNEHYVHSDCISLLNRRACNHQTFFMQQPEKHTIANGE